MTTTTGRTMTLGDLRKLTEMLPDDTRIVIRTMEYGVSTYISGDVEPSAELWYMPFHAKDTRDQLTDTVVVIQDHSV